MLRDGGRVFSPTRHAAFKRRQFAAGRNKENLQRPRPFRPTHNAAVVWLWLGTGFAFARPDSCEFIKALHFGLIV